MHLLTAADVEEERAGAEDGSECVGAELNGRRASFCSWWCSWHWKVDAEVVLESEDDFGLVIGDDCGDERTGDCESNEIDEALMTTMNLRELLATMRRSAMLIADG
ncbi:hypothetical protein QQ045_019037 [Rhodiola kirilowii]